jgi:hypothetical protein
MLSQPFQYTKPGDPKESLVDVERIVADHHRDLEQLYIMMGRETESAAPSASSSSSAVLDLSPTGVIAGSYTNPTLVVGEDGRITQASSNPAPSLSLPASGVVPGTYTLSTIVVDAYGRITAAANGKKNVVKYLGTLDYPVYANGGNARGTGAVDWQQSRSAVTQVASGNYSAILGGQNNTVSATNGFACGYGNTVASTSGFALGYGLTTGSASSYVGKMGSLIATDKYSTVETYGDNAGTSSQAALAVSRPNNYGSVILNAGDSTTSSLSIALTDDVNAASLGIDMYAYSGTTSLLAISVAKIKINTITAYNGTFSVRNSAGTGSVALTFTHGILTAVV